MKTGWKRRIFSLLLALCMVTALLPSTVLAEGREIEIPESSEQAGEEPAAGPDTETSESEDPLPEPNEPPEDTNRTAGYRVAAADAGASYFEYARLVDGDGNQVCDLLGAPSQITWTPESEYTLQVKFCKGDTTADTYLSVALPYGLRFTSAVGMGGSGKFDEGLDIPRLSGGDLESMAYQNLPAVNGYAPQTGEVTYLAGTPVGIALSFDIAADGNYINSSQTQEKTDAILVKTWNTAQTEAAAEAALNSALLQDGAPGYLSHFYAENVMLDRKQTRALDALAFILGKNVNEASFDLTYPTGATCTLTGIGTPTTTSAPRDNGDGTTTVTYTYKHMTLGWTTPYLEAAFPAGIFSGGALEQVTLNHFSRTVEEDADHYVYQPPGGYTISYTLRDAVPGTVSVIARDFIKYDFPAAGVNDTMELMGNWVLSNPGIATAENYIFEAEYNQNGTAGRVKAVSIPTMTGASVTVTGRGSDGTEATKTFAAKSDRLNLLNTNLGLAPDVGITYIKYTYGQVPENWNTGPVAEGQRPVYFGACPVAIYGDITGSTPMRSVLKFYPEGGEADAVETPLYTTPTKRLTYYQGWWDTNLWTGLVSQSVVPANTKISVTGQHRVAYYGAPFANTSWPQTTAYNMVDPVFYLAVPYGLSVSNLTLTYATVVSAGGSATSGDTPLDYSMVDISDRNTTGDGTKLYQITVPQGTRVGYYSDRGVQKCIKYSFDVMVEKYAPTKTFDLKQLFFVTSKLGGDVLPEVNAPGGRLGSMDLPLDLYDLNGGEPFFALLNGTLKVQASATAITADNAVKVEGSRFTSDWVTYDPDDPAATTPFADCDSKITYRTILTNNTGAAVSALKVYLPIPKTGQDLGEEFNDGSQQFDMEVAETDDVWATGKGFTVEYVTVTGTYADKTVPTAWAVSDQSHCNMIVLTYTGGNFADGSSIELNLRLKVSDTALALTGGRNIFKQAVTYTKTGGTSVVQSGVPVAADYAGAVLEGFVFRDANKNGVKDADEEVIPYAPVTVKDDSGRVTRGETDRNGKYRVSLATAGSVEVSVTNPSPTVYAFTTPSGGNTEDDSIVVPVDGRDLVAVATVDLSGATHASPAYASAGLVVKAVPRVLTVSKVITGNAADENDVFTFEITLTGPDGHALTGSYLYTGTGGAAGGSLTLAGGSASLTLKGGQSAAIDGIPQGTTYRVTEREADQNGYATASTAADGTVGAGGAAAVFTNRKSTTPPQDNDPEPAVYYTLTFVANGGSAVAAERFKSGAEVTLSQTTARSGHEFWGWYSDLKLTRRVTTLKMTEDKTVYAKWSPILGPVPDLLNGADHYAYIVGFTDGSVKPNANITRAEVATIFYRLLKDDVRSENLTTTNSFTDSAPGDWYNTAVSTLARVSIIKGREDDSFDPSANITRAEFAAIAARFDNTPYSGQDLFGDIAGSWAREEINRAAARGWVRGDENGSFNPNRYITRAEAVTFINRVLMRNPGSASDLLGGMKTWPDNSDTGAWYYLAIQEATNSHDFAREEGGPERWTALTPNRDWAALEKS